jgi:cysteine desulfurase
VTFQQNIAGEALIYMLDSSGIQISAGSACNSHSQTISHVLAAIGLSEEKALRTVRITLSEDITDDELDLVVSEFKKAIDILDILV